MTSHVIAQTPDGSVVIGTFEDEKTAAEFCRRERRVLRDGGYAEDVTAIELHPYVPGHAHPDQSTTA